MILCVTEGFCWCAKHSSQGERSGTDHEEGHIPGGGGGGAGTHSHRETEGCNGSRGLTMTSPKLTQDSEKKPFDKSVGF